jgi:hypothetical protein
VIDGSLRERNMREPEAQQLDTGLPHLKNNAPGEGSESVDMYLNKSETSTHVT